MIRLFRGCLSALAIASLAGCATLSEEECHYADWYGIGMTDGREGRPDARLAQHAEACEKHGVRPDADAWRAGWIDGIASYCSPSSGWRHGVAGTSYSGVCPLALEADFMFGYEPGRSLYSLGVELAEIDSRIETLEALVVDEEIEPAERRDLMEELGDLQREARALEREQALIEADAAERGLL